MDREGMDTLEFSNLEGISAELKHKFATDFVSVISKVKRKNLSKAMDNVCFNICMKKPQKKFERSDQVILPPLYQGLLGSLL
jgi:hypothetical protein